MGTQVLDSNNKPITFSVSDKDLNTVTFIFREERNDKYSFISFQLPVEQRPSYLYEFTSSQFEKNSLSELVVASPDLDRDAPSQPMLIVQVSSDTKFLARKFLYNFSRRIPLFVIRHYNGVPRNNCIFHGYYCETKKKF